MRQKKRILVCPLDWGLGHATRCIPIIRMLLKKNAEVLIAGSGRSFLLLKQEFPNLEFIDLPGYEIRYSKNAMAVQMFLSIPKILKGIKKEHMLVEEIIQQRKIDIVISDNRFGLWSSQVKTIFITHQLLIKSPLGEYVLHRINLHYIKKYNHCWIPDLEGEDNLSGDLTHAYSLPENAVFIGLLSRFYNNSPSISSQLPLRKTYDILVIISGPEPQRSIFEELILKEAFSIPLNFLVVKGVPEEIPFLKTKENIDIVSHLTESDMKTAVLSSSIILSRSGYSTLMDLAVFGKKAILIPTPGQTEQEYLAELLLRKRIAYSENQAAFSLKRALQEIDHFSGFRKNHFDTSNDLEKHIEQLISE